VMARRAGVRSTLDEWGYPPAYEACCACGKSPEPHRLPLKACEDTGGFKDGFGGDDGKCSRWVFDRWCHGGDVTDAFRNYTDAAYPATFFPGYAGLGTIIDAQNFANGHTNEDPRVHCCACGKARYNDFKDNPVCQDDDKWLDQWGTPCGLYAHNWGVIQRCQLGGIFPNADQHDMMTWGGQKEVLVTTVTNYRNGDRSTSSIHTAIAALANPPNRACCACGRDGI
jgi:hypothetical protein